MKNQTQLRTGANGFFTNDSKKYVNLDVSKSSPNRIGEVVRIEKLGNGTLNVEVQFRDFKENYVVTL